MATRRRRRSTSRRTWCLRMTGRRSRSITSRTGPTQRAGAAPGAVAPGGAYRVRTVTFSSGPSSGKTVVCCGAVPTAPQTDGVVDSPPNDIEDLVGKGEPDLTKSQIDAYLTPTNQIPTLINSSTQM